MTNQPDADKPCIEAIQTCYNGFFFRSRCEARWAVLFDLLKIKYHYEIEGYKLSSGDWYLPDFYLPVVNLWAEVKPFSGAADYFRIESDFSEEYRWAISLSRAKRFKHWEPPAPGYEPFNPPLKGDR